VTKADTPHTTHTTSPRLQLLVGLGVLVVAAVMAVGAVFIPSTAGYQGVGPNFLPWLVAAVLAVCGALLCWHATHGGYRDVEAPSGADRGDWKAIAWVSAGVLSIAALITTLGFVLSCALGFTLAVRGLRAAEGKPAGDVKQTLIDATVGCAIAAPVFWLFRKLLGLSLPALTASGWI
jgi:putative tricarboxylic transport membrane protein